MILFWMVLQSFAESRLSFRTELEDRALLQIIPAFSQEEHRKVEDMLQEFSVEIYPSVRLYYEVALLYNQRSDFSRARVYYDRALAIDSNYSMALYDRAELSVLEGKTEEARTDLEQLVAQEHPHWVIYFRLAEIEASVGNAKGMEENLLKAIRNDFDLDILIENRVKWSSFLKNEDIRSTLHGIFIVMAEEKRWEQFLDTP